MQHILLVTDDWAKKKPLKSELLELGYALMPMPSTEALGEQLVPPKQLDVVVIDLERCAADNAKLCRTLKRERPFSEVPFILLVTEAHLGRLDFSWGIEDYLTLPVSAKRLAERIKFLLWKLHRSQPRNGFSAGELVIDFERYEVRLKGAPVDLTYKEFELLKCLATHPGKVFTREVLLNKVWGYDYYGGTRTVDVHIRRLRAKIEVGGNAYIQTVRNVGYKFVSEPA